MSLTAHRAGFQLFSMMLLYIYTAAEVLIWIEILDDAELGLLQQIWGNSVQICVQSAMEIISIVSLIVNSTGIRQGFLGAW